MGDIGDGTAATLLFCESREVDYGAYLDGQATWVVTIDPAAAERRLAPWEPNPSATLLGIGGGTPGGGYSDVGLLGARGWPGAIPRKWGPSSRHAGGATMHGMPTAMRWPFLQVLIREFTMPNAPVPTATLVAIPAGMSGAQNRPTFRQCRAGVSRKPISRIGARHG